MLEISQPSERLTVYDITHFFGLRYIAVIGLILITLLPFVSCKKKTPDVSVVRDDSEVSALSSPVTATIAPNSLSEDQFDDALRNLTTAPNYVLVSVTDANSELPEVVCVTALDFLAAICNERELGLKEAQEYALKKKDRTYQFSNARAIQLLSRNYSDSMLTEARIFFVGMTVEEIEAAIRLYSRAPNGKPNYAALAHALAERGILSVKGCLGEFRLDGRTHNQRMQ